SRQPVVEDTRPMDPEGPDVPVVERLDVAEQLHLPARQVAVEVVLLLPTGDEEELAIPLGRFEPLRKDVPTHVPEVGPAKEGDIVIVEPGRAEIGGSLPEQLARLPFEACPTAAATHPPARRVIRVRAH